MTRYNGRGPARRPDVTGLDPDQRQEIETGWGFFDPFCGSREIFERCWKIHREEVLNAWITRFPRTRPFAWWLFDAIPKHGERQTTNAWTAEHEANRAAWMRWGILHTGVHGLQETEESYLRRNDLLTADELH
ncbi:MAG: hypothetical protein ACYC6N_18800 [Pirellulaceae bacterium]